MTDDTQAAFPIDVHPDPVLEYAVSDDGVRVTGANQAFETTFSRVESGTPLAQVLAEFDTVRAAGDEELQTRIARGTGDGIYLDGLGADTGPHAARVLDTGEDAGFVQFTPIEACLDGLDMGDPSGTDADVEAGDVASVVSHDLRNPLDVAKAHLRAARETGDAEHFDAVASAHDRMERIVRDVLTLANVRDAISPTEQTAIDAAAGDAWRSVDTGSATLDVAESLPTATADADRLRRLFENLFRNSVEHGTSERKSAASDPAAQAPADDQSDSSRSGVTVRVGSLDGGFFVADDGPGVDPGERDVVFDPGYSASGAGTGLGLAIVERIAEAHGWTVTLTTAPDGGARFEIRF